MEQGFKKVLEEFPPVKNSDGLQGYARLGYFVNGSANVYAPTDDNSVTGEFGQVLNKYRLVGSQCGQSKNSRGVATVTHMVTMLVQMGPWINKCNK